MDFYFSLSLGLSPIGHLGQGWAGPFGLVDRWVRPDLVTPTPFSPVASSGSLASTRLWPPPLMKPRPAPASSAAVEGAKRRAMVPAPSGIPRFVYGHLFRSLPP